MSPQEKQQWGQTPRQQRLASAAVLAYVEAAPAASEDTVSLAQAAAAMAAAEARVATQGVHIGSNQRDDCRGDIGGERSAVVQGLESNPK